MARLKAKKKRVKKRTGMTRIEKIKHNRVPVNSDHNGSERRSASPVSSELPTAVFWVHTGLRTLSL
jgi:hypothetical protein